MTNKLRVSSSKPTKVDAGLDPANWGAGSLAAGDQVWVYEPDLGEPKAVFEIVSAISTNPTPPKAPWILTLNPIIYDPSNPPSDDDPVSLRGNIYDSVVVEQCQFTGGRGVGVMLSGPNVVVRDCIFTNLARSAIRVQTVFDVTLDLNSAGPPPHNVTIENNVVNQCNAWSNKDWPWDSMVHWGQAIGAIDVSVMYEQNTNLIRAPRSAVHNVLITGNAVQATERAGICVASTTNATIEGNVFGPAVASHFLGTPAVENSLVYLENCLTVSVVGNSTRPGPQPNTERSATRASVAGPAVAGGRAEPRGQCCLRASGSCVVEVPAASSLPRGCRSAKICGP